MHAKLLLTLCWPMDYSPPGSSVHGIFHARILEWVAISFSRGPSWPKDQTRVLESPALAGGFFTTSATWEAQSCYFCCSVPQSCPTLCNPMDCSTPGFLVLHHLPGIAIEVSNFNSVFVFVFFWPQGMWDVSSCTRDRTHTSCIGSTES